MIISLLAIQTLASVLAGVTIAQAKSEQMSDQAFAKYLFRHTSLTQIKLHDKVYSQ